MHTDDSMMLDRGSLYYLLHTRMSAATAYGCKKSGGSSSTAGTLQRCAGYLLEGVAVLLLAWVHVGIICAIPALLWATTEMLGVPVSWHVCLASYFPSSHDSLYELAISLRRHSGRLLHRKAPVSGASEAALLEV